MTRLLKKLSCGKSGCMTCGLPTADLLIEAGESLAYIRDQLGHHSIKVTVGIYGHLAPEGNKEAVDRLDDPALDATIRNLSATKTKKGPHRSA